MKALQDVLSVVLLAVIVFFIAVTAIKKTETTTEISPPDTVFVTTINTIIDTVRIYLPAEIDSTTTELEPEIFQEYAQADTVVSQENLYNIKLNIKYWFEKQLFVIESVVEVQERIIEKTITETIIKKEKTKFISPIMGISFIKKEDTLDLGVNAGLVFRNKLVFSLTGNTGNAIGINVSYIF